MLPCKQNDAVLQLLAMKINNLTDNPSALRSVQTFAALDDEALGAIAEAGVEIRLKKHEQLPAEDYSNTYCYLADGEVELLEHGRHIQTISAHTERASQPLFRVQLPGIMATSHGNSTIICIDREAIASYVDGLGQLAPQTLSAEAAPPEIGLSEAENALLKEIHHRFTSKKIDLPSLPEVATQINIALHDPDINLKDVAKLINTDPVIAARIMQAANSAIYGGGKKIIGIQEAVFKIGLQATRTLVLSVVLHNLFVPQAPLIKRYMHALYEHSIYIAALSHAIARRLKHFDADYAMLAGLIHDIGIIPILIFADKNPELNDNVILLDSAIHNLHGFVGGLLLNQWGFDHDLVVTAEESDDWFRDNRTQADYCDIVLIAQLHTGLLRGKRKGMPAAHEVPAFARLQLAHLKTEGVLHILDEAKRSVSETVRLLHA